MINKYFEYKNKFGLGSKKDSTWIKSDEGGIFSKGYHSCCNSKHPYYHKVGCQNRKDLDDLSDLKDLN